MTALTMSGPQLTIGMPVFNGGVGLRRAVDSLLAQSLRDFELVISDNASTDETPDVLAEASARDARIRVVRQPRNIGAHANFGYVLSQAKTRYFMWAAADDLWAPAFAERNVAFLEAHPDYVASISRVLFHDRQAFSPDAMGTFALRGNVAENIRRYLVDPSFNSRFYAVHVREALQKAWLVEPFWASDWAIILRELQLGKFNEESEVLMQRSYGGASSNHYKAIRNWRLPWLDTWLPMLGFTRHALQIEAVRTDARLWLTLMYWNLRESAIMLRSALRGH